MKAYELADSGLSPPTRGNLGYEGVRAGGFRSIPAHAGEPDIITLLPQETLVYPRPRGGTCFRIGAFRCLYGLSPPTRGNPCVVYHHVRGHGSIPAHAGEPCSTR